MRLNTISTANLRPATAELITFLQENADEFECGDAEIYFDFPLYKDLEGNVVIADFTFISPYFGLVIAAASEAAVHDSIEVIERQTVEAFDAVYAKLMKNPKLKRDRKTLLFDTESFIFCPNYQGSYASEIKIIGNISALQSFFTGIKQDIHIDDEIYRELLATIDGSKGLPVRTPRVSEQEAREKNKGWLADLIENEIAQFDQEQKLAYMTLLTGPERIRGLAGSGKTVVLAMKAALTHLRYPDAKIVYTFYTKSLYQHIRNTITRLYRQFDDRDPNWDNLIVAHAWGGETPGLYSSVATRIGKKPYTFSQAQSLSGYTQDRKKVDPFDFVCNDLMKNYDLPEIFDYTFIDEGQDFGPSFIQFCATLTKSKKICWAYDELQTIFRAKAPSAEDVGLELHRDVVLHKCYRNPLEILVTAHSIGFGIYGQRIVQMLENKEHWEDLGYRIVDGDLVEGETLIIERPTINSPSAISRFQAKSEIVSSRSFVSFEAEIEYVCESICKDVELGLKPKDILVISVDDRAARGYISFIAQGLLKVGIKTKDRHSHFSADADFFETNYVTLTTVHKAKGNEAYMVYVVGCDYPFSSYVGARSRNIMFTALTRAKGWVRTSGVHPNAAILSGEINQALANLPKMVFEYPSDEDLRVMRRDLSQEEIEKRKRDDQLRELLKSMSPEEVAAAIGQMGVQKK